MKRLIVPLLLAASSCQASLCDSGLRQSPINITPEAVSAQKLPAMQVAYRAVPLKLTNDGHTVRVRFDQAGQLVLGQEHYKLQQFHFHAPGGDQLNGEHFPMSAHILHRGDKGQLLAIVVPFRLGAENALLKELLPLFPAKADGDHKLPNVQIDASRLLPTERSYYRYSGSLTDAPCTENVEWLVMKQPLELSAAQLAAWHKRFADNMRAPNPLHQRLIRESL